MTIDILNMPIDIVMVFHCFFRSVRLRGGSKGGTRPPLCGERGEVQRAERAKVSEASQSERKRAVVYLKLGTIQPEKADMTQTKNYTEHSLNTVHKTYKIFDLGTANRGARGGGRGVQGLTKE